MNEPQNTTGASNEITTTDLFAYDEASQPIADNGDDRDTSNEPNETQSQEGDTAQADDASTSQAEPQEPQAKQPVQKQPEQKKFVSRGEKRETDIKNAIEENKRLLREIRETQSRSQVPQQANATAPAEPIFVQKPQAPQFTREQLTAELQRAAATNDDKLAQAAQAELKAWDKHDTDLKFWKIENDQKIERFNSHRKHFWQQAVTRFPDLAKQDSPLYQEAKALAQKFPEIINRQSADGEYLIAQLAGMRIERKTHASKVGALEEQVKKLTDKLNATQKKIMPASQGAAPTVSKAGEGSTAEDRLASKLAA